MEDGKNSLRTKQLSIIQCHSMRCCIASIKREMGSLLLVRLCLRRRHLAINTVLLGAFCSFQVGIYVMCFFWMAVNLGHQSINKTTNRRITCTIFTVNVQGNLSSFEIKKDSLACKSGILDQSKKGFTGKTN